MLDILHHLTAIQVVERSIIMYQVPSFLSRIQGSLYQGIGACKDIYTYILR